MNLIGRLMLALMAICIWSGSASALTYVNPVGNWGNDPETVLVGMFSTTAGGGNLVWAYPVALYKNTGSGTYAGSCLSAALPHSTSGNLSDNVIVYGADGPDSMRMNKDNVSVTCGSVTYFLLNSAINFNGYYIHLRGKAGNDDIRTFAQYPSYIYGDVGDDTLAGDGESCVIFGGEDSDFLRGTNAIYNARNRYLYGNAGTNCLEDNNTAGGTNHRTIMNCGGVGNKANFGDASRQDVQLCPTTTNNHCVN